MLSSLEAEYHSMVEGAVRAGGLQIIEKEVGATSLVNNIVVLPDSRALKQFYDKAEP